MIIVIFCLLLRREASSSIPDSEKFLKRFVNCKFLERSLQFVMISVPCVVQRHLLRRRSHFALCDSVLFFLIRYLVMCMSNPFVISRIQVANPFPRLAGST